MLKKMYALFLSFTMLIVCGIPVGAYKNSIVPPTNTEPNKVGNQIGDPYIMKYNGVYYLYAVSYSITYCWSSRDLINWDFYGDVMAGKPADNPAYDNLYAPEVYYIDGKFYMYGSPMGLGHYFYVSDSPTGPFTVISEKLDENYIDGTVFMDGDNTLYFLCGEFNGVRVKKMSGPTDYSQPYYKYNAGIANSRPEMRWTEGPTMFKRKGVYYLTYTGNQVWEKNYRVEYAYSHNLDDNFTEENDNIVLLNTEGDDNVGLGHNGIVVGPDLDTYYIVYHNSYNVRGASFSRRINLDKLTFNGEKLCVQGPTTHEIDGPQLPDFYDYFEDATLNSWTNSGNATAKDGLLSLSAGATLLTKQTTGDIFSAEFNLKNKTDVSYVTFGYVDSMNYGRAYIDKANKVFVIQKFVDGKAVWTKTSALNDTFAYESLHSIVIKQDADNIYGLLDGVERITHNDTVNGGKIGYFIGKSGAECGFTAFSGKTYGSCEYESVKPVPSKIPAVQANNINDGFMVCDASGEELGNAVSVNAGQMLSYKINARQSGTYTVDLKLNRLAEDLTVCVMQDGKAVKSVVIPADGNSFDGYNTYSIRNIKLSAGKQTLGIFFAKGSGELYEVNVLADSKSSAYTNAANNTDAWTVYETEPQVTDGKMVYSNAESFGKALVGDSGWGDYSIEGNVTLNKGDSAGFIFRATSVLTGLRESPYLCDAYFQRAYYVGIEDGQIILEKHRITEYTTLATAKCNVTAGRSAKLKVSAVGNVITVYLDGVQVLRYADKRDPYTLGSVGVRSVYANSVFEGINITPETGLEETATPELVTVSDHTHKIEVDPARFSGNGFKYGFVECVESPENIFGKKLVMTVDARGRYENPNNPFLNTLISATVPVTEGTYTLKATLKGRLNNDTYIRVVTPSGQKQQIKLTPSNNFTDETTVEIKDIILTDGNARIDIENWAPTATDDRRMEFSDIMFIPEQDTLCDMSIEVPNEKFAAHANLSLRYGGIKSNSHIRISGTTSGTAISTGPITVPNGVYSLRFYVKNTAGQKSAKFMANVGGKEYYDQLAQSVFEDWTVRTIDNIAVTNNSITVMMWYSNTDSNAKIEVDGIELLRMAFSGKQGDVASPVLKNEYDFDKVTNIGFDAMSFSEPSHVTGDENETVTLNNGVSGYVHKQFTGLANGTYCVSVDVSACDGIGSCILKANPTASPSGEMRSSLLSGGATYTRRLTVNGINVTDGRLYLRLDYSTVDCPVTLKNLRIMRVGTPNYLTVNYGGVVLYPEKALATRGEDITVSVKKNISPAGENYRFVGFLIDGARVSEELSYTVKNAGPSPSVTAAYYYMPQGVDLYDANDDGDIDIRDLVRVKKHLAVQGTKITVEAADIDGNYSVDVADMTKLKKHLLGVF